MLEDLVNKNYKQLNENDKYIWAYVSKHKRECESLSIDELASRCNVSRTTILRFSKRLGMNGYSEFKIYLKMSNGQSKTNGTNIANLQKTYVDYCTFLSTYNFQPIIEIINNANNLYIYGRGTVQKSVVSEWKRSFLFANKLFFGITSLGETEEYEAMITSEDVIVIVSFSGETELVLEFVKKLRVKHVKIIVVTASKQNSLATLADVAISIDYVDISAPMEPFRGLTGYFLLIDYLVATYLQEAL